MPSEWYKAAGTSRRERRGAPRGQAIITGVKENGKRTMYYTSLCLYECMLMSL